jgi:hypothetical protein
MYPCTDTCLIFPHTSSLLSLTHSRWWLSFTGQRPSTTVAVIALATTASLSFPDLSHRTFSCCVLSTSWALAGDLFISLCSFDRSVLRRRICAFQLTVVIEDITVVGEDEFEQFAYMNYSWWGGRIRWWWLKTVCAKNEGGGWWRGWRLLRESGGGEDRRRMVAVLIEREKRGTN